MCTLLSVVLNSHLPCVVSDASDCPGRSTIEPIERFGYVPQVTRPMSFAFSTGAPFTPPIGANTELLVQMFPLVFFQSGVWGAATGPRKMGFGPFPEAS